MAKWDWPAEKYGSLVPPAPTSIVLAVSNTATGPWSSTSLTTTQTNVFLQARVLDQYGNPFVGTFPAGTLKVQVPGLAASPVTWGTGTNSGGYALNAGNAYLNVPGLTASATAYNMRAFIDANADNAIQTTEAQSNLVPVTVTP